MIVINKSGDSTYVSPQCSLYTVAVKSCFMGSYTIPNVQVEEEDWD